jgi:putative hemolysin
LLSLLVAAACNNKGTVTPQPQLPNPASVYCQQQGGMLDIVDTPQGMRGMCTLPSGQRCEEWAYFRGECGQQGEVVALMLESLFLSTPVRLGGDERMPAHQVSLRLSGPTDAELEGTLHLDPNTCTLDAFGDPEICTLIATFGIEVELERLTLQDPAGLGRRIYGVEGDGLPEGLRMVVQGELASGRIERAYLMLNGQLVPMFVERQAMEPGQGQRPGQP